MAAVATEGGATPETVQYQMAGPKCMAVVVMAAVAMAAGTGLEGGQVQLPSLVGRMEGVVMVVVATEEGGANPDTGLSTYMAAVVMAVVAEVAFPLPWLAELFREWLGEEEGEG
jgi:hypothetical protein